MLVKWGGAAPPDAIPIPKFHHGGTGIRGGPIPVSEFREIANFGVARRCAWALLTGVVVSLFRKLVRKFTTRAQFGSKTIETERDWVQLGLILAEQAALFALFATQLTWWAYFTHWLAPLVLIAPVHDHAVHGDARVDRLGEINHAFPLHGLAK